MTAVKPRRQAARRVAGGFALLFLVPGVACGWWSLVLLGSEPITPVALLLALFAPVLLMLSALWTRVWLTGAARSAP